jgi:hypothetical protein
MPANPRETAALAVAVVVALGHQAAAIEMFTNFGDGSRIGLPSLEVPIEAYPGIPLRSDRIRARRGWRTPLSRSQPTRPPTPPARGDTTAAASRRSPAPPLPRGSVASPVADPEPLLTPASR